MTRTTSLLGLSAALLALACNEVPVGNLTSSYVVQIEELREHGSPAKLDIVWVIDDSPSMCQEQQSLAASFDTFLSVFQEFAAIDMRLAVTTTNVCAADKAGAIRGKFVYQPAEAFPPECVQKRVFPCLADEECQKNPALPDKANWVCESKPAQYLYTCDKPPGYGTDDYPGDILHTVNSICRYKCDREGAPATCARVFGEPEGCTGTCEPDCSIPACQADTSLTTANSCGVLCAVGADCDAKCNDILKDAAQCQEICALEPEKCFPRCAEIVKAPDCSNICEPGWNCVETCEAYLFDTVKCGEVCSAGDCFDTCANDAFSKQDFLCSMVCDGSYSCNDKCTAEFGDASYRCLYPGGDQTRAGCVLPPATAWCPANGPTMLDAEVADRYFDDWKNLKWAGNPDWQGLDHDTVRDLIFEQLFICMASVGAQQNICGSQEQGLLAAWMALDRNGENGAQAASFLRDDAFLLIIFVSDEDDCSSVTKIPAIEAGQCACKADTNGCTPDGKCDAADGPLYPASTFINRLKSVKPDPAQVVVAAIVGDVVPGSETSPHTELLEIRDRFYECKCDKGQYAPFTYGCLSAQGKADIGNRYMQVAAGFGTRYGQVSNICDDQGLDGALTEIANLVIPLLTAICLPRPMSEEEFLQVYLVNEFNERFLQVADTDMEVNDYKMVKNFPTCPKFDATLGYRTENAIQFTDPLEYLDRVEIVYQADPFFFKE